MTKHRNSLLLMMASLPIVFSVIFWSTHKGAREIRWDLTESKLYTLSTGTQQLLSSLDHEVRLVVYFSEERSKELAAVQFLANRLDELLGEMQRITDGLLQVEWQDPMPFSEAEDQALLAGLGSVPVGVRNEAFYFGIVIEGISSSKAVIPFLSPDQEGLLEYRIIQAIQQASRVRKPRIALISGLPIQNWQSYLQIQRQYDLVEVPLTAQSLPSDIDLVMLVQPTGLEAQLLEALVEAINDQQRFLILVDPLIQSLSEVGTVDAGLAELFKLLGLAVDFERFVADGGQALQVTLDPQSAPLRHPAILGVTSDFLSKEDVVTTNLVAINLATAGQIEWSPETPVPPEVLLQSSSQSAHLPVSRLLVDRDASSIIAEIISEIPSVSEQRALAVRITQPIDAVIVADVDFLADRYWVSRQNLFGTEWLDAFASNVDFILNVIDNLVGDPALIGLRSRDIAYRPFELVDELRRLAEVRLLDSEIALERALDEANMQLARLRSEDASTMSESDRRQFEVFLAERSRLRQELRLVQETLDRDIDAMGQRLAWMNILLVPSLILLLYLIIRQRMFRQR